jgi:hypothetical protein
MSLTTGSKIASMSSGTLGAAYLSAGNLFLRMMQALIQANIINQTTTTPPATPNDGDTYIVAAGSTGAWSGHTYEIAYWSTQNLSTPAWDFWTPKEGWLVYDQTLNSFYFFNGSLWTQFGGTASGANVTPGQSMMGVQSDQQNKTYFILIPGSLIMNPVSSFKLVWNVSSFGATQNLTIGQIAILRTAIYTTTVLDATAVTISGTTSPVISIPSGSTATNPQVITTDTVNLTLDAQHDYWLAVYFTNVTATCNINNCPRALFPSYTGVTGNHTGDSTIPSIPSAFGTGFTNGVLLSRVVVP